MSPPIPPPTMASATDSAMTETTTGPLENPSARRVAISRVRLATAVYMVLMAPNTAPMPIRNAMTEAMPVMMAVTASVCPM